MACCYFPRPTSPKNYHAPPSLYRRTPFLNSSSLKCNPHHSFPFIRDSRSGRCYSTRPESEPPSKKHPSPFSGVTSSLARFQDTTRIFFAVLFWMSLFFWSSIWDGKNGDRPKKRPHLKK